MDIYSLFPIEIDDFVISRLTIDDIAERSRWPSYEGYHKGFNLNLQNSETLNRKFNAYSNENTLSFTLKHDGAAIGLFSFNQIDWSKNEVGNMTIRVHPYYCNKGIGQKILIKLCEIIFNNGIKVIKLDVHSKNKIAETCYKKCGFKYLRTIKIENEEFYYMEKRSG